MKSKLLLLIDSNETVTVSGIDSFWSRTYQTSTIKRSFRNNPSYLKSGNAYTVQAVLFWEHLRNKTF